MTIEFTLPAELEAHDPPEARGTPRDGVRMRVSRGPAGKISHHRFTGLPELLRPGDLIVINTSGTLPAAVTAVAAPGLAADGPGLAVHFSGPRRARGWLVDRRPRRGPATVPYPGGQPGDRIELPAGAGLTLD